MSPMGPPGRPKGERQKAQPEGRPRGDRLVARRTATRRRWLQAGLSVALLGPAAGGAGRAWAQPSATASPALGQAVAWPEVQLLDGQRLGAADWSGSAWVVVFFATWCGHCARHLPRIERLRQQLATQPLRVLGVADERGTNATADADAVRQHLRRHGLQLAVTLDSAALHRALSPRRTVPLTCVVDRQGRLREVIPGEMAEDDVMGLAGWAHRS